MKHLHTQFCPTTIILPKLCVNPLMFRIKIDKFGLSQPWQTRLHCTLSAKRRGLKQNAIKQYYKDNHRASLRPWLESTRQIRSFLAWHWHEALQYKGNKIIPVFANQASNSIWAWSGFLNIFSKGGCSADKAVLHWERALIVFYAFEQLAKVPFPKTTWKCKARQLLIRYISVWHVRSHGIVEDKLWSSL